MLNEQPPEKRRHPLEEPPRPRPGSAEAPRQRVTLRIPAVKPTVTYLFLAVNILVFIVRALSPALDEQIFLFGASRGLDVLGNGQFYRLLTAMFLHAGLYDAYGRFVFANSLHLIFNAYAIYWIGLSLEPLFGHARFIAIYLLGGLTGSILSVLLGDPNTYSVGASGAVFAILGAEFVYLYQHRKLLGERVRGMMRSLVFIAILNLGIGALSGAGVGSMRIDNWAHLGGLIGGLILAWLIGPIFVVRSHPDEPGAMIGEDINPLRRRRWMLTIYATVLLLIVVIAGVLR